MRCYTTSSSSTGSDPYAMVLAAARSAATTTTATASSPPSSSSASAHTASLRSWRRVSPLSLQSLWDDGRSRLLLSRKSVSSRVDRRTVLPVKCEIAGEYEESFADVDKHLLDYFTFKAVRTVLVQLYEMNPSQYTWFYRFVVENKPQDSKVFLRGLAKERQELAERVMVTRLHLYNLWIKKYDHAKMYQAISDQNLELLRERLVQTVKWPAVDEDTKET